MLILNGTGASRGIAAAPYKRISGTGDRVPRRSVPDAEAEVRRFELCRERAVAELEDLYEREHPSLGEEADIFNIHAMMLEDRDFRDCVEEKIRTESIGAECAVEEAGRQFASLFSSMDDPYLRERADDVADISQRLIRLLGATEGELRAGDAKFVFGAANLLPSQTVKLDRSSIAAFVTGGGSPVSHAAILSRALGIPAVVGLGDSISRIRDGCTVIVDGGLGRVLVDPDEKSIAEYEKKALSEREAAAELAELVSVPSVTRDGQKIEICANIGGPAEADGALSFGAEGIGLFRSEYLFLGRDRPPTEDEQFGAYRAVLEKMGEKRVVIRTADIGADKRADYLHLPAEENPALGCRAIRLCLRRPELFRTQLRALLRASAYGRLAVMLPMIISAEELRAARGLAEEERTALKEAGIPVGPYELGIMVETPAAALCSDELAEESDFFSVGTNDLTQYTLAVDRMNDSVRDLFQPGHPAVLSLIRTAAEAAHRRGKWIGICGEAAADPDLTQEWLRLGIDELSMSAVSIPEIRKKVRSL